jgi:hypothetical protein
MTAVALEAAPARTRAAWLVPGMVALVAAVVTWWASMPYLVGVFHDDGVYALLAQSIATGHGFHYLQLPGHPAATHYPPLYPLALAAVWWLAPGFPENIPAMLGLNAVCIGIAAAGMQRMLRAWYGWSDETAAIAALCAFLGVPVLTLSSALMSESLFLACLFPVLRLTQRALRTEDERLAVVAGCAIGALMLVRTHALALLGAAILLLLATRHFRRALFLGGSAIAVQLPWILWCRVATPVVPAPLNGTYGAYPAFFMEGWRTGGLPLLLATMRANLVELWLLLGDRVWGGLGVALGSAAVAMLVVLLGLGLWRAARRSPVLPLFLALYFGIIVVMSCAPYRYAWGMWPVLVALAVLGAEQALASSSEQRWRMVVLAGVAIPFLAMSRTEWRGYETRQWEQPARGASRAIAPAIEWVRRNTNVTDVVLVEAPEIVTLFTGRIAAPPMPFTALEYVVPLTADDYTRGLRAMLAATAPQFVVTIVPAVRAAATASPALHRIEGPPDIGIFAATR